MREDLIEAIEEQSLTEFVIDQYNNMPMKTVRRLLILLAEYVKAEDKEDLIEDVKKSIL